MARCTTNLVKQFGAVLRGGGRGKLRVSSGSLSSADEARKAIDVGKSVGPQLVVWLRRGIAEIGHLVRLETAGDAHLIEVSVGRKRQQAGLLVFPAKSAYARLSRSFQDGHIQDLPANFPM